jgi:hypothetical protein
MARAPMPAARSDDSLLFEQLAKQAIDETETEIFTEATGADEPENDGDKSLEATETIDGQEADDDGEVKSDDDGEEPDVEDSEDGADEGETEEAEPEVREPDQRQQRRGDPEVPLRQTREELRAERERVQRLEAELAALRVRPPEAVKPPEPQAKPDMFSDPEGHERWVLEQATQRALAQVTAQRLEASLAEAHQDHGEEFTFAYSQAKAILDRGPGDPEARALHARINNSPDPGRALMRWAEPKLQAYREEQQAQEDERLAEMLEARGIDPRQVARLVAQNGAGARREPMNGRSEQSAGRPRLPSLNSQTGNGAQRYDPRGVDGSEQAIWDDATNS